MTMRQYFLWVVLIMLAAIPYQFYIKRHVTRGRGWRAAFDAWGHWSVWFVSTLCATVIGVTCASFIITWMNL